MKRTIMIEVKTEAAARAIQCALEDKEVLAMLVVLGTLKPLPSKRLQEAVLNCAMAVLDEYGAKKVERPNSPGSNPQTPLGRKTK